MEKKSYGLDIIRVISALLVFIPHIIINLSYNLKLVNFFYIVSVVGVELFFCLSGYLICKQGISILVNKEKKIKNSLVFVVRRLLRTWPAYFFALLSYTIFYKFFEKELIFYFFFIQNLFYPIVSNSFFSVSWSITVEELFYFIFPILLCLVAFFQSKITSKHIKSEYLIIISCFVIIIIIYLLRLDLNFSNWGSEVRRVALLRIDAIAFGGLGYFFIHYLKKNRYIDLLLLVLAFILISLIYYNLTIYSLRSSFLDQKIANNYIFYLIYIFSICLVGLSDRTFRLKSNRTKKIISELANWSYPLYLMHIIIIDFVKNININNLMISAFIIIIINFLCAYLIRKYIELPFLRIRPNYQK